MVISLSWLLIISPLLGPTSGIPTLAAAYSYHLEFRPTQRHSNADGLSRLPVVSKDHDDSIDVPEAAIFNIVRYIHFQ